MVYPKSNLPTAAQPWGRYVEKDITTLQTTVATERVNNAARDAQNSLNIKRIDESLTTVKQVATQTADLIASTGITANKVDDLETNVYYPGTVNINGGNIQAGTITGNKINANYVYAGNISANQITSGSISGDRITGGTITGTTVQTSSGNAVVLDNASNSLYFRYSGSSVGSLRGTVGPGGNSGVQLASGASTYMFMQPNQIDLISSTGGDYGISLNGSTIYLRGTVSSLSANSASIANACSAGSFSTSGAVSCGSVSSSGSISGTTVSSTNFSGTVNTSIAANTTASFYGNVFINTSGQMFKGLSYSSSREIKENIQPLEFDTQKYLSIDPVTFDYKESFYAKDDRFGMVGFIAEDFEDAGFSEVVIPENFDGPNKGLRYDKLYMYLHKVVQEQDAIIKSLTARIEALEAK
jgi:hypothetical protein